MASHQVDTRLATRVAGACPVRRPRCHHLLRTLLPSHSVGFTQGHDAGMQRAMESLLEGMPGDAHQQTMARDIASLPMRMGGRGGGLRNPINVAVGTRGVLGILGGRFAHAGKTSPSTGSTTHNNFGGRTRGRLFG